jgi:hypothetical protein
VASPPLLPSSRARIPLRTGKTPLRSRFDRASGWPGPRTPLARITRFKRPDRCLNVRRLARDPVRQSAGPGGRRALGREHSARSAVAAPFRAKHNCYATASGEPPVCHLRCPNNSCRSSLVRSMMLPLVCVSFATTTSPSLYPASFRHVKSPIAGLTARPARGAHRDPRGRIGSNHSISPALTRRVGARRSQPARCH